MSIEKKDIKDVDIIDSIKSDDSLLVYSQTLKKTIKIPFSKILANYNNAGTISANLFQLISPLHKFVKVGEQGLYEIHRQTGDSHSLFLINISYANSAGGTILVDVTTHSTNTGKYRAYQIGDFSTPTLYVKVDNAYIQIFVDVQKEYWYISKRNIILTANKEQTIWGLTDVDKSTLALMEINRII